MRRYLFVIELKPEYVKDYIELHKNPWPEILKEIKNAGVKELLIWSYKNLSIVYYECEDINKVYEYLGTTDATKRWNIVTGPWLAESPSLDGSSEVVTCEKIFDLQQQLNGKLEQY